MPYTQFLTHTFDCLEVIHFSGLQQNCYCIWYSDEAEDGFLTQACQLLTFADENSAVKFIQTNTSYRAPVTTTIYDADTIEQMMDQQHPFDACITLEFWNIAGDLANSAGRPFQGNIKDDLTDKVYDKLFYGNNLPEINTSGHLYTPEFTDEEYTRLMDILADAVSIIHHVTAYRN